MKPKQRALLARAQSGIWEQRIARLVQWYNGYGESLIDYNYNMHRIGVGVLLTEWL